MDLQKSIETLTGLEWSQRRIARELQINRETVARYRRLNREAGKSNPAIPPTGSADGFEAGERKDPGSAVALAPPKPAIPPAGRRSLCQPFRELIISKLELGLTAQRIYQDLKREHQFGGGYDSVKCFVKQLGSGIPLPFRRMECGPGEEAQIDYGQGAWVVEDGKRKRPHLLRVILSFSRKGYTEVFWQQTSENFIRGLENAFRHFGGVPKKLVTDNLKAAVIRADWFDPELNPKIISFCEHYHCVMLPTKPVMPRHKGKVESGVNYAQCNAVAGRTFKSLAEQNEFLAQWEKGIADTRIHGTTKEQVGHRFETEKGALLPLPAGLFPVFSEAPRQVHRDGHVEVARSYYSVPPEYVGRLVWVRWDTALVRIQNERHQPIAIHPRVPPGRFSTLDAHIHSHKRSIVERGSEYLLDRSRQLGSDVEAWSRAMYQNRGVEGMRVMQGFLQLAETYSPKQLNEACKEALTLGAWRLREVKTLLQRPSMQPSLSFLEEHPLIRPLRQYQELYPDVFSTPLAEPPSVNNQPEQN